MEKCPICNKNVKEPKNYSEFYKVNEEYFDRAVFEYDCEVCGKYKITKSAKEITLKGQSDIDKRYILSGVTRQRSDEGEILTITDENYDKLLDSASLPDGPLESMDRILIYLEEHTSHAAEFKKLNVDTDYPIVFAKNAQEFKLFLGRIEKLGWVQNPNNQGYRLTTEGWRRLAEIKKDKIDSSQSFVAMWFDKNLDEPWANGFKAALNETGYKPIRIDIVEHNEKICDRIIAEIRRSGLLIADFTGNRGGVYFEAGFALGLGIPVIWTCEENYFKNNEMHFDTRQYKHIIWKDSEDLRKKLINRIEATLPNRKKRKFDKAL